MNTPNSDHLLQEYTFLRSEIDNKLNAQDSLINICLTLVCAIFTISFSAWNSYLPLIIQPFTITILLRFNSYRDDLARKTGYIIVFIEQYLDIKWETHNAIEYKTNKILPGFHHSIWIIISLSTLICNLLICLHEQLNIKLIVIISIYHVIMAIVILCIIVQTDFKKKRIKSITTWKRILENYEEKIYNEEYNIIDEILADADCHRNGPAGP